MVVQANKWKRKCRWDLLKLLGNTYVDISNSCSARKVLLSLKKLDYPGLHFDTDNDAFTALHVLFMRS